MRRRRYSRILSQPHHRANWRGRVRRARRIAWNVLLSVLLICVLFCVFAVVGSQIYAATHSDALAVGVGIGYTAVLAAVGRWWAARNSPRAPRFHQRSDTSYSAAPIAATPTAPSSAELKRQVDERLDALRIARTAAKRIPTASRLRPTAIPATAAPKYVVDRAASAARADQLQSYLEEQVLSPRGQFICGSAHSCKTSLKRADTAFLEAQGHMVGPCYDLTTGDGIPLRILVVPMEAGGSNPDYQHLTVAQRTSDIAASGARAFRGRNPHMRGVTFALRLALGLPVDDPGVEHVQFTDGSSGHLFSCFAMTNLLLCSAVATGTMSSRSTSTMRTNCARHLIAAIRILQPTLVISQGQGLDRTLRASLGVTATVSQNLAGCTLHGNDFTWASLYHPTRNWSALSHPYLREVVVPTLNEARSRALSLPRSI